MQNHNSKILKFLLSFLILIFTFYIVWPINVEASHPSSCAGISVCITNVQLTKTSNSARVTWTTNVPTATRVQYGVILRYPTDSPSNSTNPTTSHTAEMPNLNPNTFYTFVISSMASDSPNHTDNFTTNRTSTNDSVTITAVSHGNISETGATITWTTNVPATSQVKYWTGSSRNLQYQPQSPNSNLTTSHSITLSSLNPNTEYSYQVLSMANNFPAQGTVGTFRTQRGPCTDPVCISNVQPSNLTPTSVTISWTTNVPADTQVKYGPTPRLGLETPLDAAQATNHNVNITGLNPGMTYYFEANSVSVTLNNSRARSSVQVTMGGTIGGPITGDPGKSVNFRLTLTNPWTGVNSIFDAIDKITDFLLTVAVPIAVILIVYAGLIFLTSGGNTGKITQARTILWYTMVGFTVILIGKGFYLLIESVLNLGS